MVDMMIGALHDPFHTIHMGVTAENIAAKWGQAAVSPMRPAPHRAAVVPVQLHRPRQRLLGVGRKPNDPKIFRL
jgi:hypothetical protein